MIGKEKPPREIPEKLIRHIDPFWWFIRAEAGFNDAASMTCGIVLRATPAMRGVSLPIVSRLLGHSRLSMTMRHDYVGDELVESAEEKVGAILAGYLDAKEV